jgi:hypothetical protein
MGWEPYSAIGRRGVVPTDGQCQRIANERRPAESADPFQEVRCTNRATHLHISQGRLNSAVKTVECELCAEHVASYEATFVPYGFVVLSVTELAASDG